MPFPAIDPTTLYVVLVIFGATLIRSTFGFGEALIAVPLLALRIPVAIAAPLAMVVSVVVAGVIVGRDWRRIDFRSAGGLVIASLVGIPLGTLWLTSAPEATVKRALGVIIIAFSLYSLAVARTRRRIGDHPGWLLACGVVAGILGGAYGMNGPPLVAYGALRRWSPQQFRATLQGYFLPASLAGLVGYWLVGLWSESVTHYLIWSLPGVAVAILFGNRVNDRMQGHGFFRVVYGLLLVIGAILLVESSRG